MKVLKSNHWGWVKTGLILLIFVSYKTIYAGSWYVSTSGNDTLNGLYPVFSTGYNGPKATINAALGVASPGDTINIASGTYNESVVVSKDIYINAGTVVAKEWTMNGFANYCLLSGTSLSITDTLFLKQGYMYINATAFKLVMLAGSDISGGSVNSYVEGRLYRELSGGTGRYLYPLGLSGDYRAVYLNYTQVTADTREHWMEMVAAPAPHSNNLPAGIRNLSKIRYWNFGRVGSGQPTNYIFELGYDSSAVEDHVYDYTGLRVVINTDTSKPWINLGGTGDFNRKGIDKAATSIDTTGILAIANTKGTYNPLGTILPFANYTYTGVCQKSSIAFTNKSKNLLPAKITQYKWDFGVGAITSDTSSLASPSYSYTAAGTYNVQLVVVNDSGYSDTMVKAITIKPLPVIKISAASVCFNQTSTLIDSSSGISPDTILTSSWDAGDGFKTTGKKVTHKYAAAGGYTVKLVTKSSAGCIDSATKPTLVRALPKMDFTTSNECSTDTAFYHRTAGVDANEATFTYSWYADYKFLKSDTQAKHVYNNSTIHRVTLVAVDPFGCADSMAHNDTSFAPPQITFALDQSIGGNDSLQCKSNNKFIFKPHIVVASGETYTGSWNYGDGNTGILTDTSHSYASLGTYTIKLFAKTNRGCKDSFASVYKVRGAVSPTIAKIGICAPDSVTLYDSLSASSSPIVKWRWVLPGGAADSGKSIRVLNKFVAPGPVKLIITNAEGCTDSASVSFTYTAYPVISFNISGSIPFCPGDSLVITAMGGKTYLWLTDSDTSSKKVFKTAGTYKVRAFNGAVCTSLDSQVVKIFAKPVITAKNDTSIVRGNPTLLTASGGTTYTWSPAASLSSATGSKVTARPIATTMYIVKGTDANGCSGTDTVTITILEPPFVRIPNIITPNGDGLNDAWVLSDVPDLASLDVTITDYAGKIVFQSSSYQNDWSAVKDGKNLPNGIYYYKLKNRSSSEVIKGFIQVIR